MRESDVEFEASLLVGCRSPRQALAEFRVLCAAAVRELASRMPGLSLGASDIWATALFVGGLPTREAFEADAVGYSAFTL